MAKLYELTTGYKNIEYLIEMGESTEELEAVLNSIGGENKAKDKDTNCWGEEMSFEIEGSWKSA